MIEKIKNIRVQLNEIELSTEGTTNSKVLGFTEQVELNLILGRSWLGESLKGLGNPYPYEKDENRKSVEDIKPAADTSENKNVCEVADVEQNSMLRKQLEETIEALKQENSGKLHVDEPIKIAIQHFTNARIFLGFILGVIRETSLLAKELDELNKIDKPKKADLERIMFLENKLSKLGTIIDFKED